MFGDERKAKVSFKLTKQNLKFHFCHSCTLVSGYGTGKGKSGAKRHNKIVQENIQGITKPAIRRMARRTFFHHLILEFKLSNLSQDLQLVRFADNIK